MEKCLESIGRLQHRCTTKNLPVCNDTIVVLKIILLHIISVITNFVIPNRKKKTDKKQTSTKTSHFSVYSRRATNDTHHSCHADKGGPCRVCYTLTFWDTTSSFTAAGY